MSRLPINLPLSDSLPIPFPGTDPAKESLQGIRLHGTFTCFVEDMPLYEALEPVGLNNALADYLETALLVVIPTFSDRVGYPDRIPDYRYEIEDALKAYVGDWQETYGVRLLEVSILYATTGEESPDLLEQAEKKADKLRTIRSIPKPGTPEGDAYFADPVNIKSVLDRYPEIRDHMKIPKITVQNPERQVRSWTCLCGAKCVGKFCRECGTSQQWYCWCGQSNLGNFCIACGSKREPPKEDE